MATAIQALDTYLADKGIEFDYDATSVILTGTLNPLALSELVDVCGLNAYGVWIVGGTACLIQKTLDDSAVD